MMMLRFISIWTILFTGMHFSQAKDDGLVSPNRTYTVVSDLKDKTVKAGTFELEGIVRRADNQLPLQNISVVLSNGALPVLTDEQGRFHLVGSVKTDSAIYFYHDGFDEVVIDNYVFKDQHRITVNVFMQSATVNAVKRKPVVYLYAAKPTNADIAIDPKGDFTFTYPTYENGWNVAVNPAGGVTDLKTGKNYPYLFWEATSNSLNYQVTPQGIPGFVIQTDSAITFLESQLTALGLNTTEQTDFITFWGPILQKQRYAFVQFLVDDVYESAVASMQISPRPDAVRRVYILCAGLDAPLSEMPVIPQQFNSFERFGFTVVEWGGSELKLPQQTN